MLRMSKMTDYGTVILSHMAQVEAARQATLLSANDLAGATSLALPTVSKVLKSLSRAGLVSSHRGAQGGYELARPAQQITAAQIIDALEGPVAITECASEDGHCELESICSVGGAWQRVNHAIRRGLQDISLAQLSAAPGETLPALNLKDCLSGPSAAESATN